MQQSEPRPGKAKCLKCQKQFDSRDITTNRICPVCTRNNLREYVPKMSGSRIYSDGHHGATIDHDSD